MKSTLLIALLAALAINYCTDAASLNRVRRQLVPPEFRNINIDTYLKNPRSVLFQLKCIVYDGPCDRIGKYLKVTIPELITGTCQHCSPSDRQTAGRLVAHIQKNYPKEWHDAIKKYQGGQVVTPDLANKFKDIVGVPLDADLVSSTAAPVTEAPVAVPSSVAPVVVAQQQQPASSSAPALAVEAVKSPVAAKIESKPEVVAVPDVPVAPVAVEAVPTTENTTSA